MKNEQITYSIQQVADMVGVSKQLIRKWEDRYQIIAPCRLDNGYRIYSYNEVAILQDIKRLTDAGHSPKHAAEIIKSRQASQETMSDAILSNPIESYAVQTANFAQPSAQNPTAQAFVDQLITLGASGKDGAIVNVLQQAQLTMGVETLLKQIITPFLCRVGDLWYEGVWGNIRRQYRA